MASVRYTFTLNPVKDSDIVRWLDSQPNFSAAVREALRAYIERPSNVEIVAKLDELLSAVQTMSFTTPPPPREFDEPEAAARGFEKMRRRFEK